MCIKKDMQMEKISFPQKNSGDMDIWKCTKCLYPFDGEEEAEPEGMCDQLEDLTEPLAYEKRHS